MIGWTFTKWPRELMLERTRAAGVQTPYGLHVIGGVHGNLTTSHIMWDGKRWHTLTSIPTISHDHSSCYMSATMMTLNGINCNGGSTNTNNNASINHYGSIIVSVGSMSSPLIHRYDITLDKWFSDIHGMTEWRQDAKLMMINNSLYFIGGTPSESGKRAVLLRPSSFQFVSVHILIELRRVVI
jgi:hypothetical protein